MELTRRDTLNKEKIEKKRISTSTKEEKSKRGSLEEKEPYTNNKKIQPK